MIKIAIVIVVEVLIVTGFSFFYKKKKREKINKKENKLWFMYGISMFVADVMPKKLIYQNFKVKSAIERLEVKGKINKALYEYAIKKISICLLIIFATVSFSLIMWQTESEEQKDIQTVERSDVTDKQYAINIKDEKGNKEKVTLNVEKRQYTSEEIKRSINKAKKELIKKVLGKNKSAEHVDRQLNLVSEIGENIGVSWSISDNEKIDYEGNLSENIDKQGELINLTATMSFQKVSEDYMFSLRVYPPVGQNTKAGELQKYINENQIYNKQVNLPNKLKNKNVTYGNIVEKYSLWILIIGVFFGIAVFFLKDTELKGHIKERERQLNNDYPEIVSKIMLYYGAGLSFKSTVERIVNNYQIEKEQYNERRYAYEELESAMIKMKNGVSERVAISEFGTRCRTQQYIKLSGLIEQNIKRGTRELSYVLKNELIMATNEKKNNMLKSGGQISTKLLGPMVIMLIISIVVIMAPALMSMGT